VGDFGAKLVGVAGAVAAAVGAFVWSVSETAERTGPDGVRLARMSACGDVDELFKSTFAPVFDVVSITPMDFDKEGERHGRIGVMSARRGAPDERADIAAFAPVEARVLRVAGDPDAGYSIDLQPCDGMLVRFEGLERIAPQLAAIRDGRADALVRSGDRLGVGPGFRLLASDLRDTAPVVRRLGVSERRLAGAAVCPLGLYPDILEAGLASKLGDEWGLKRARGPAACGDLGGAGSAAGAWRANADDTAPGVILAADPFNENRARLWLGADGAAASHAMIDLPRADILTRIRFAGSEFVFPLADEGRVNVIPTAGSRGVHCIENLRAGAAGPRVRAVVLSDYRDDADGEGALRVEIRDDVESCSDLPQPWRLSANAVALRR